VKKKMKFMECIRASETLKHTGNFKEEYVDLKEVMEN
jgi:hypothetical protein